MNILLICLLLLSEIIYKHYYVPSRVMYTLHRPQTASYMLYGFSGTNLNVTLFICTLTDDRSSINGLYLTSNGKAYLKVNLSVK